jgi:hypothetical protein
MKFAISFLLVLPALIIASCAGPSGAEDCAELKAAIDKTYGFKPSRLTAEEINAKSDELDKVWEIVDADPAKMLPCLKTEIENRKEDTFFRFNASNLLLKHDKSPEARQLVIKAYTTVDLADLNQQYWLPLMAQFGFEGMNVSGPAQTWLRYPEAGYYLPQHGTRRVDKAVGALALFGSMEESKATPALAKLAANEDADHRNIVTWLLVNQATEDSDAAARELSSKLPQPLAEKLLKDIDNPKKVVPRSGTQKISREAFIEALNEFVNERPQKWQTLTSQVPDGERDLVVAMNEEDLPLIRLVRRRYAANASPHSPEWYEAMTEVINTIRAKGKKK